MILLAIAMCLLGLVWHPTWYIFALLESPAIFMLMGAIAYGLSALLEDRRAARSAAAHAALAAKEPGALITVPSIDPADRLEDDEEDGDGGPDPDDGEPMPEPEREGAKVLSFRKRSGAA